MREAPPKADLCGASSPSLTKALVDGQDVTEIGLMRNIALRARPSGRLGRCERPADAFCAADEMALSIESIAIDYIAISITYVFASLF
jgi:hypothetical protein